MILRRITIVLATIPLTLVGVLALSWAWWQWLVHLFGG